MYNRPTKDFNSYQEQKPNQPISVQSVLGPQQPIQQNTNNNVFEPIAPKTTLVTEPDLQTEMSKIICFPNGVCIYISGLLCLSPPDFSKLKENDITTIITIMDDLSVIFPPQYKQYFFKAADMAEEKIEIYFEPTWLIMSHAINSGENILVHCRAGISRSVTIFISFMLKCLQQNFPLPLKSFFPKQTDQNFTQAILIFIRRHRKCANPNIGFMLQLYRYEQSLKIYLNE